MDRQQSTSGRPLPRRQQRRSTLLLFIAVATAVTLFTAHSDQGTFFVHAQRQQQQHQFTVQDSSSSRVPSYDSNSDSSASLQDRRRLELECHQILAIPPLSSSTPAPPEPFLEPTFSTLAGPPENSTWRLWYRKWTDLSAKETSTEIENAGFLLGNGQSQVLVGGGIHVERIRVSEESSWAGGPGVDRVAKAPLDDGASTSGDEVEEEQYRGGNVPVEEAPRRQEALEKMRLLVKEKGQVRPREKIVGSLKGDERGFGSQLGFGELLVEEVKKFETVREYRRELDLETGVATVTFSVGDLQYKREHFCSFPDGVCVMRLQASEPKSINVRVSLSSAHENTGTAEYTNVHNRLGMRARLASNNMTTEAMVAVTTEGATGVSLANNRQVVALGFDAVTLYYTMGTGWTLQGSYPNFEDKDPHDRLTSVMDKAVGGLYGDQYLKHVQDHQTLFQGFRLDLGQIENKLPTDELLKASKGGNAGEEETYLDALMVQYARYLLIASSRPGSLPLSGRSMWSQDQNTGLDDPSIGYKMDIDLQMNYWLAESTGLGETVTPLIDYMENLLVPRGQDTASLYYGARGWLTHPYSNIWAHTGPTAQDQTFYLPTAAAWLCQHAWDRYLYSQDYYFLRDHAYKLMKGAAQFWVDTLVRLRDEEGGPLVVSPSFAPGHGGVTEGTAMDQQLVWQLLNNTLEAIAVVGERDRVFAQNLTTALEVVAPGLRVGSWGQLQEWSLDMDDPNERHPHLGYLWAVYPGNQVFFRNSSSSSSDVDEGEDEGEKEPTREELLEAARESLIHRGMGDRPGGNFGWAKSWRAAVWARLEDGKLAYRAVETFKRDHIFEHPNLLDFKDGLSGLLGVSAAMVEMVIQSRAPGFVDILTVADLPDQWLRRGGSVEGFRTRDGHVVSSRWEVGGTVRQVEVYASLKAGSLRVKIGSLGGEDRTPSAKVRVSQKGSAKVVAYSREGDVVVLAAVVKGETYVIDIDD
ncbi:hypothetical protein KI688_005168 [Linnemannia hyalina]|uniref:Glycoside hydrolase family 95 protein n=1 Tax=Linnemannia hyalina TaxID=64524 RepID=A0A9P8BPG4_9FUNG|nr:hypothetical protein KI688_005168 [Linnemannia hyalina]